MKRLMVQLLFAAAAITATAQEICNNGKDDDGDGFIDCYDSSCSGSTFCKDFFLGEEAQCEVTPPAFPQFTMSLDFSSPNQTTNHLSRMAIGDLDRDGIPEIVTMNRYTKRLFILNGKDGTIKHQKTVDFTPNWELAIANVDDDDCGEIFFLGTDRRIYAYDCELNYLWRTAQMPGDPINYGVADFDGDGRIELYAKDIIFDAHTGTRLVNTTASNWSRINGGPVAVDMQGDEDLELVIGCSIYAVNLGNRTQDAGSLVLLNTRPEYFIRNEYNATSVADFNLDGHLDILASGSTGGHGQNTTVFFWDVHNNTLKTYSDPIDGEFTIYACPTKKGEYYKNGWINGTGRLNIADLDGDGHLNVSYVSGKFLYALDHNLEPLPWSPKVVNEETSGHTGCTLFDFNGDGKSEIVYRDERFLYIINGTDGSIYNQQTCISRTNREYPIVADVDADGSTEMCVTCGFDDQDAIDNFCDLDKSRYSHVRVFKSGGDPWVPARRVWNQHGYFNVNVNDDLTIPQRQQKHHLVFSEGSCTQGPNRPLNGFLNQSPFLNIDGCPTYKSPDLAFVDNSLVVNPPTCPDKNFNISFQIRNIGDIALSGNVNISFYDGDPLEAGATRLGTLSETVNLPVNDPHTINAIVPGPGGPFTLYIVLNDNGSTVPTPISLPNTHFLECDYANNIISASVTSLPATIGALKIADNIKCPGSTTPDNGAARAFVSTHGNENVTHYNFFWSTGTTAKAPPADFSGADINGLTEGTYTVYALHKTLNCSSDTAMVTIHRIGEDITATIDIVAPYTNCKNPDGELRVLVNGGDDPDNYSYVWYEGNDIFTDPQVSISDNPKGLKPITYAVVVTDLATGCPIITSAAVPDQSVIPVVAVNTTDITCASGNIGSTSATVDDATAGYTFRWYGGDHVKPSPDFSGDTYNNLAGGNYTVVAQHNTSFCESEPVTVTINESAPITVSVSGVQAMTSCDDFQPNGAATASVDGTTAGYTFEWFVGQNTIGNPFAAGATLSNLGAGVYTVRATANTTGCTDTEELIIDHEVETPVLTLAAVSDMTNCAAPNGTVTVDVSLDAIADYTFLWYEGSQVKATPDFTATGNTLNDLATGTYTVVAVHNSKHCTSAPLSANVEENTPLISIIQEAATLKLPTDCGTHNGEMSVTVTAAGNVNGFLIEWFVNGAPTPLASATGVTTSFQTGLSSARYTVRATNLDNGCASEEEFELPFADAHTLTLVSKQDATTCSPQNEGEVVVQLTPTPAAGFTYNDYKVQFYSGEGMDGTLLSTIAGSSGASNGNGTANFTLSTLTPGFYTVVAIEDHPTLNNCVSVPVIIEILGRGTPPVFDALTTMANTSCADAIADGSITLDMEGVESDYSYQWFEGNDHTAPVLGTHTTGATVGFGHIAQHLPPGTYFVMATNIATQCAAGRTATIQNRQPTISIPAAAIDLTHVTLCSDLTGGTATIMNVFENGTPAGTTNYSFTWLDANQNTIAGNGPAQNNLTAGQYFVIVNKVAGLAGLQCASRLIAFEVEDQTQNTVAVALNDFTLPTRCLQPGNITGALVVNATGTSASGYTFEWYAGDAAAGPIMETASTLSGIIVPDGQTDITYTVRAINNSNDCFVDASYTLPLDIHTVMLSASASNVTSCISANGTVFATVTSGGANNYTYNWYAGITAGSTPDFTGRQVDDLPVGSYTIVAVDNTDNFCQSTTQTVVVEDARKFPVVTANALAPLTVCDPSRPDGVATASVGGDVVNYFFDWYNTTPPSGAAAYRGATYGNLSAGTFTVIASHILSGCTGTADVTINEQFIPIPLPAVEVMADDSGCGNLDNGVLAASVNGNTGDFIFHWYNTNPGQIPPDTTMAVFIGEVYSDLGVGTYYASATSRTTGCISRPAPGEIIDATVMPDFDFDVSRPTCAMFTVNPDGGYGTGGEPTGSVVINMLNSVELESIGWYVGSNPDPNVTPVVTGPILSGIQAGTYSVIVTSTLGCRTSRDVEVLPEINAFNGISRNGDDQNPIFHINCIENYPNNAVKIYNRAGTLVYQASGYNNVDIYFDGKSNKGVSLMGTDLPDGTYYYIVEKNDGTGETIAGYLEIVN